MPPTPADLPAPPGSQQAPAARARGDWALPPPAYKRCFSRGHKRGTSPAARAAGSHSNPSSAGLWAGVRTPRPCSPSADTRICLCLPSRATSPNSARPQHAADAPSHLPCCSQGGQSTPLPGERRLPPLRSGDSLRILPQHRLRAQLPAPQYRTALFPSFQRKAEQSLPQKANNSVRAAKSKPSPRSPFAHCGPAVLRLPCASQLCETTRARLLILRPRGLPQASHTFWAAVPLSRMQSAHRAGIPRPRHRELRAADASGGTEKPSRGARLALRTATKRLRARPQPHHVTER